jgi:hypothetical protein
MEVKINIESNQIGDTVIDLFKNLSAEKKEELALQIMKEWLQSPDLFETTNYEQLVIDEFRQGKRSPDYYNRRYDVNTDEAIIRKDDNFKRAINEYKTSKQILTENLKSEVVDYYKKYIAEELKNNETIERVKVETMKTITQLFPSIIMQVMIEVFASNLTTMQQDIYNTSWRAMNVEALTHDIMSKVGMSN